MLSFFLSEAALGVEDGPGNVTELLVGLPAKWNFSRMKFQSESNLA